MEEKYLYLGSNKFRKIFKIISRHPDYIFYKAVKINRKYRLAKEKNNKLKILYYGIKANRFSSK